MSKTDNLSFSTHFCVTDSEIGVAAAKRSSVYESAAACDLLIICGTLNVSNGYDLRFRQIWKWRIFAPAFAVKHGICFAVDVMLFQSFTKTAGSFLVLHLRAIGKKMRNEMCVRKRSVCGTDKYFGKMNRNTWFYCGSECNWISAFVA